MATQANNTATQPRWRSLAEASEYSGGIPISTLRDWIRKGRLPAYRLGPRQLQVDLNDLDALRQRVPTAKAPRRAASTAER